MGKEIDQLNYKVILDDEAFNSKITTDLATARAFNKSMSEVLEIKKKVSSADARAAINAEKVAAAVAKRKRAEKEAAEAAQREADKTAAAGVAAQQRIQREIAKTGTQAKLNAERELQAILQTELQQERLNKAKERGNSIISGQSRLLQEVGGLAATYFSVRTVERFISSLVRVSGEFELQQQTLRAILQDVDGADRIFTQMQELAVRSPFSFSDLTSYAKQLSAFSVPMEELYDTTKMLADVSAGLGVDMSRIILAYGQIRSAAFLRGQEVRQLTEAGIPILTELAKQFQEIEGRMVSAGEVFDKISSREVPFEMVEKVFKDMTSEGGKFYQMQEVQAETLKAKVKNLGDQYDIMLYQIGQAQDGLLKGSVSALGNLMQHWQAIGRVIVSVASGFGAYAAVLAAVWTWKKALAAIDMVQTIIRTTKYTHSLVSAIKLYVAGLEAAGVATKVAFSAGVVGIVTAVAVAIYQVVRAAGELNRELEKIKDEKMGEADKTIDSLDKIVAKLAAATQGSQDYRDAIHELNSKYGEYLPNLITEKDTLDQIRIAADGAAEAIRNKARASALASGQEALDKKYGDKLARYEKSIVNTLQYADKRIDQAAAQDIFNLFATNIQSGKYDNHLSAYTAAVNSYLGMSGALPASFNSTIGGVYEYWKAVQEYDKKRAEFEAKLNGGSGTTPLTQTEREGYNTLEAYYKERERAIRMAKLTEDETRTQIDALNKERVENYVKFYGGVDVDLGNGNVVKAVNREDLKKKYEAQLSAMSVTPKKGAKLVQEALASVGITAKQKAYGLWADESTDFSMDGYYKELDQQYKDAIPSITRAKERFKQLVKTDFDKATYEELDADGKAAYDEIQNLVKRKNAIEAVAKGLGYSLEDNRRAGTHIPSSGKSQSQKDIETRIDLIKEVQRAYNDLIRDGYSASEADSLVSAYFSFADADVRDGRNFWEELAAEAEALKKFDKESAARLTADIARGRAQEAGDAEKARLKQAKEDAKEAEKLRKQQEKDLAAYQKTLRQWMGEDFNLGGSGFEFDINKVISDLNSNYGKVEEKYVQAVEKAKAAHKGNEEAIAAEIVKLDELRAAERKYYLARAQDSLDNLAQSYLKDEYFLRGIDLTNISNKSIGQLRKLKKELKDIEATAFSISDEESEKLVALGVNIEDLTNTDLEALKGKVSDATYETLQMMQVVQKAGLSFDRLRAAIKKAVTEGFDKLSDEEKKSIASFAKEAVSRLNGLANAFINLDEAMGGTQWGEAVGGISEIASVASDMFEVFQSFEGGGAGALAAWLVMIVELNKKVLELAAAEEEAEHRTAMAAIDANSVARMQGENGKTIFGTDAVAAINERMEQIKKIQESIDKFNTNNTGYEITSKHYTFWHRLLGWMYSENWSGGGAFDGELLPDDMVSIEKALNGLGFEVFDKYGNLNAEGLKEILNVYGDLRAEEKEWIERAIKNSEDYAEAMEGVEEVMNSIFQNVASSAADTIIDQWIEAKDAALDYADVLDNVARSYAKMMIQSLIISQALDPLKEDIEKAFMSGDYERAMGLIAQGMESVKDAAPLYEQILNAFDPYFQRDDEDSESLGNGIKGITEDTANLLASYLNAIRADVSYMRMLNTQGWADVKEIRAMLPSPTVWEHIAKIEANTASSAATAKSILKEIQNVITTEDGAPAIRSSMQ